MGRPTYDGEIEAEDGPDFYTRPNKRWSSQDLIDYLRDLFEDYRGEVSAYAGHERYASEAEDKINDALDILARKR